MAEKPNDIDELQDEFDRRVALKSRKIYEYHSTRCQSTTDGEPNCEHMSGLATDARGNSIYRLCHVEMDPLITELLLESKNNLYVTHEPMIERPTAHNVTPIVMHRSHLFHHTALMRLITNSQVKHMIFTEPKRNGDRPYEPWIFKDKYVNHFKVLESMVLEWVGRYNREQAIAARRNTKV